ncbi:hypothetical protein AB0C33_25015 [Nonomuraea sp. NPDC048881]|uniref:hypothetical protein n=1 Tax=Nonomuraea sp. NPDC048881 TaxID=3155030 RepID=UPI0033D50C2A
MPLLKAATASVAVVVLVAVVSEAATGVYYAIDLGMVTQVLPDERRPGAPSSQPEVSTAPI